MNPVPHSQSGLMWRPQGETRRACLGSFRQPGARARSRLYAHADVAFLKGDAGKDGGIRRHKTGKEGSWVERDWMERDKEGIGINK